MSLGRERVGPPTTRSSPASSQQRDDLIQAEDRLDRIGQNPPVTFWYCLAPNTVDEVIMQSHRGPDQSEDAMLQHIEQGARRGVAAAVNESAFESPRGSPVPSTSGSRW